MTMKRIFDLIGWLGTAIVAVAVALSVVPRLNNYAQYSRPLALGGLVCVLIYVAGLWQEFAKFFSRRQARYGALLVVNVLVVLGILVLINVIGKAQNKRWDLTANKQFSLSDQSRSVLTKLDSPMQIMVFVQESEFTRYQDKMKEYEYTAKKVT